VESLRDIKTKTKIIVIINKEITINLKIKGTKTSNIKEVTTNILRIHKDRMTGIKETGKSINSSNSQRI